MSPRRIMILGQPGAGKSTLARGLGERTGLPVLHIDTVHWMPGWTERPRPLRVEMVGEWEARERWIIEGGLSETWRNRAARCDLLIWLDLPLAVRLAGVARRRIAYRGGQTRPDLPSDCPEQLPWEFVHWIWRTRRTGRERIRQLFTQTDRPKVRLRSRPDANAYLAAYSADHPASSSTSPTIMPTNRR